MENTRAWFPVRFDLIEQTAFRALKYTEVVLLLDINYAMSQYLSLLEKGIWQGGDFKRPDSLGANRLHMSLRCYRGARAKLGKLGWINYQKGCKSDSGKMFPTKFYGACYSRPKQGVRCAIVYRDVWQRMITALYHGQIKHQDLTAFVYLAYTWELCAGVRTGRISLRRSDVESLTGMAPRAFVVALKRLRQFDPCILSFELAAGGGVIEVVGMQFPRQETTKIESNATTEQRNTVTAVSCNQMQYL